MTLARACIDAGADMGARDNNGFTPVHMAVYNEHDAGAALLSVLLAAGAAVDTLNNSGQTAFEIAEQRGNAAAALALRAAALGFFLADRGTFKALRRCFRRRGRWTLRRGWGSGRW